METHIRDLLGKYKLPQKKKKRPPHALSASADEIEKLVPFTDKYPRGLWLRHMSLYCKRHKKEPAAMYNIVLELKDKAEKLDKKYSKGGWLYNQLKK